MKYYVDYSVYGHVTVEVEANSLEEAEEKGEEVFGDADLGDDLDIGDCELYSIEEADGKVHYYD